MTIPARAHFVWIGPDMPWAYAFALMSAAARSELDQIVLHHTDALADTAPIRALAATPGLKLARIEPLSWLASLDQTGLPGTRLAALYSQVASPVARSNMLRAAALFCHGGIYLDLDTLTVCSLRPLLDARLFIGTEHIVWPHFVKQSRSPWLWSKSLSLSLLRSGLRRAPDGYRYFRHVASAYYLGINGAILGAEARAPFLARYLEAMAEVPTARVQQKHALGTHLLQRQVELHGGADLVVHPPALFYPLAPEISEHWFRTRSGARLDEVIQPETRVVHWYASVRSKPYLPLITPEYVLKMQGEQLYSQLVVQVLERALVAPANGSTPRWSARPANTP